MIYSTSSSCSIGLPAETISSPRAFIFVKYSVAVIPPFLVVDGAIRVFTALERVCDTNMSSMIFQAAAAVSHAATWTRTSLERDARMYPRTC